MRLYISFIVLALGVQHLDANGPLNFLTKLTPNDGAAGDTFGATIAASGDLAAIGASNHGPVPASAGAVFLFERSTSETWVQIKELNAADADVNDVLGASVAIDGDTVLAGANGENGAGNLSGAAYIFQRDYDPANPSIPLANNWGQVKKLVARDGSAPNAEFGISAALEGSVAVVGAHKDTSMGGASGAAYVFYRDEGGANNWGLVKKLVPSDAHSGQDFGLSLSLSGETLAVGAPGLSGDGLGAVYIFSRHEGGADQWGEVAVIPSTLGSPDDNFGSAISLQGSTLAVGAPFDDDLGGNAGAVYVFERHVNGLWNFVKKFSALDTAAQDWLGSSVSLDGNSLLVGVPRSGVDNGSAYLFQRDAGGSDNWGQVAKLVTPDGALDTWFGAAVATTEETFFVGAYRDSDNGMNSGAAYVFALQPAPPTIICPPDVMLACDESSDPSNTGEASATDDCEGDPVITYTDGFQPGDCPQEMLIMRTWTATDSCGSASTCVQLITVVDSTPPTILCPPDVIVACGESIDASFTGLATATDNCDANPVITVSDSVSVGICLQPNLITRTWTASDACGNSATCTQLIMVDGAIDLGTSELLCPEDIALNLAEHILDLDLSLFTGPNDSANRGRRKALASRALGAAGCIVGGDYDCATEKLLSLLAKIDGETPPPDWMVDSPEKSMLADQVNGLICLLQP